MAPRTTVLGLAMDALSLELTNHDGDVPEAADLVRVARYVRDSGAPLDVQNAMGRLLRYDRAENERHVRSIERLRAACGELDAGGEA